MVSNMTTFRMYGKAKISQEVLSWFSLLNRILAKPYFKAEVVYNKDILTRTHRNTRKNMIIVHWLSMFENHGCSCTFIRESIKLNKKVKCNKK